MDEHRFDTLTRELASTVSRRRGMRLLAAAGAALLAVARGKGSAAQEWYRGPGEPCWDSGQCVSPDAPYVCDDNGFPYDGAFNCCTFEGSRCYVDEHCCGYNVCAGGVCRAPGEGSTMTAAPGDPCRPAVDICFSASGAFVCDWVGSTADYRCCTNGGDRCGWDGQCCGDLACVDGACRPMAGGSGVGVGACTREGCTCVLYRDPECRASCPLYDPCDTGLVCTGTSEAVGTCVPAY
jgi:hypothetical protein